MNIPDPDGFTFPACIHKFPCPNPVILSADRPDQPQYLNVDQIGCNYINLSWRGSAYGPDEGYIIEVYSNPELTALVHEYIAHEEENGHRVPDLTQDTLYYIHIHQYDDYAEEDSEPCPTTPNFYSSLFIVIW